jgi:hypothetical protein
LFTDKDMAEEGYSLLASALLAIQHFNGGKPDIVPEELAGIEGDAMFAFLWMK